MPLTAAFHRKQPIDSMGEALGEVFHLPANPGENDGRVDGDERHRFSSHVEQRRESIFPAKLKVGSSCTAVALTTIRKQ